MSTNDGGPAFPVPLNPGQPWQGMAPCDGMTLRDYFAAKAMAAMIPLADATSMEWHNWDMLAGAAYAQADAMLAAREASNGK